MTDVSGLTILVVDHGLFFPLAQKLAEQVERVLWWSPCDDAFPTVKKCLIGDGFDNVERVEDPWQGAFYADLVVVPDIGFSAIQMKLRHDGEKVWGSGDADELEINRGQFLKKLKEIGLPVPEYDTVLGLTNLRLYLQDKEDKYIKISRFRGDIETTHWTNWSEGEALLDFWAFRLGSVREQIRFYVLDPIDTEIEDGIDTYCIDGKMPSICIHGMEAKDKAYLGTFTKFSEIDERVRGSAEAFAPVLGEYGYRNFFSTEVRITEDASYFIDPTLRAGSPPSQVQLEMIANLAEVMWAGANGECIEPEPAAKFGVQAGLTYKGDKRMWREVLLPDDLKQWVKCGFCLQVDDVLCFPPEENNEEDIGWLVATGDTIQEAIDNLKGHAAALPARLCCDTTSLVDLLKEAEEAEKLGIEFTPQDVPTPESVVA